MKRLTKQLLAIFVSLLMAMFVNSATWAAEPLKNVFMLNTTSKSMGEVVKAVKSFAKKKHWVYLGDYKVKNDKVILVNFCVKEAGKIAWRAGLKVSAMLPCGNMGVYKKDGVTEISLLNPYYMTTLYPDLDLETAADLLMPLYKEMMVTIVK